jgi:hypothetical protein
VQLVGTHSQLGHGPLEEIKLQTYPGGQAGPSQVNTVVLTAVVLPPPTQVLPAVLPAPTQVLPALAPVLVLLDVVSQLANEAIP